MVKNTSKAEAAAQNQGVVDSNVGGSFASAVMHDSTLEQTNERTNKRTGFFDCFLESILGATLRQ
jgi:hypothetical protein